MPTLMPMVILCVLVLKSVELTVGSETKERNATGVPRKLHFVWLSTEHWDAEEQPPTPPDVADRIARWKSMQGAGAAGGKDWEVLTWDNRRIKQTFPELLKTLSKISVGAWASDLALDLDVIVPSRLTGDRPRHSHISGAQHAKESTRKRMNIRVSKTTNDKE